MKKTSVYLPDALKDRLAAVARATGRSEAQLLRLAVERLVASEPAGNAPIARREDPVAARYRPGPALVGVGVGPGDPGLVTRRAVEVLRGADRVVAPSTSAQAVGRAEAIVREVAPDVTIERVTFVMEVGTEARAAALEAAADALVAHLDAGERVAFVTLGDPNVYSTFSPLGDAVRRRRPAVPVEVVPGIMAFQDLAARTGTTVVDGTEHLVLVPAHAAAAGATLEAAAADPGAAVVVYKGGAQIGAVAATLAGHQRLEGAVIGELLGLPGGRVAPLAEVADRPASYLATMIVPPVREPR
ncbi:MAG TPA: precorrin-2 C(20)-methyltransferase [Acidimicrobiales bacterium]|nr:precorrin-2 C(20)-methyltransferase [Acidimicrobiales bacterium]